MLELREKAEVLLLDLGMSGSGAGPVVDETSGRIHEIAISALVELGFSAKDARGRV